VLGRALSTRVEGRVPAFVRGSLFRVAPYLFRAGSFRAGHWFDGLALLHRFRFGEAGVEFAARSLQCQFAHRIADDARPTPGMFGTTLRRPWWRRLVEPVPPITDNTNVCIAPIGPDLVALTEGTTQLRIDPGALVTLGPLGYGPDALGPGCQMLAHFHEDHPAAAVLNLATALGRTSTLTLYQHAPGERVRRPVNQWRTAHVPYVHSFGLTPRVAVIIDHPARFQPLGMLWSNRGLADHFVWEPGPTRLVLLPRDGGAPRIVEAPPMFVFHVANAFDDGPEVVLDVAAHADLGIVRALGTAALATAYPAHQARLLRLRIPPAGEARVEPLADEEMEFPAIAYRERSGRRHGVVWGANPFPDAAGRSRLFRFAVDGGASRALSVERAAVGEPLFVRDPAGAEEHGVLLALTTALDEERATLLVVDATTMEVVAQVHLPGSIPLGFHGSFVPERVAAS
jgi:carotenoid cleavage dioxygenase-like enzyme